MLDEGRWCPASKWVRISCVRVSISLMVLLLLAFGLSATYVWHSGFGWHDHQRLYQIVLLSGSALVLLLSSQIALPRLAFYLVALIALLGFVSVLGAEWPSWALKEWGRYVGLAILALFVGLISSNSYVGVFVLGFMAIIGSYHAYQFIIYYAAAFISGIYNFDADVLFNGFSNPRFFGQFQVLLMPVLAGLVWHIQKQKPLLGTVLFVVLSVHWCIALTLGGRGLLLGLGVSSVALLMIAHQYWKLIATQACAGCLGLVLFILLFHLIPAWLDIFPDLRDSLRTSLSGRERIWLSAWEMAKQNPWLGVGPMHYAATYNPIAAHPHQVVLQWAAEWGIPATLMALSLGVWGMWFGLSRLREGEVDNIGAALWLSIAGALILAQVDGVFVMPYTETWLAILVGLAIAKWSSTQPAPLAQRIFFKVLAIPVILIIGNVLINEAPTVPEDSEVHMAKHHTGWTPRFWAQGWIPMDGVDGIK